MTYEVPKPDDWTDSDTEDLQMLLVGGYVSPTMAWLKFLATHTRFTGQDLVMQASTITWQAECRHCEIEIASHNQKDWYHTNGGYKGCSSANWRDKSWKGSTAKASPEKRTIKNQAEYVAEMMNLS